MDNQGLLEIFRAHFPQWAQAHCDAYLRPGIVKKHMPQLEWTMRMYWENWMRSISNATTQFMFAEYGPHGSCCYAYWKVPFGGLGTYLTFSNGKCHCVFGNTILYEVPLPPAVLPFDFVPIIESPEDYIRVVGPHCEAVLELFQKSK